MNLLNGSAGSEVTAAQRLLGQCGFHVGVIDGVFGPIMEAAVVAFQTKYGLKEDGILGPRSFEVMNNALQTCEGYLEPEDYTAQSVALELVAMPPQNALDERISEAVAMMQVCDDGQGCRYGGWINPYLFDKKKFKQGDEFPIPLVGKIVPGHELVKPIHGGTCSPWAGLFLGWYLCTNGDFNFRIGRSARRMANWKHDQKLDGITIPGFGDYTEVEGVLRLEHNPLNNLYAKWDWLNRVNIVEMDHHIILVLKVGGEDGLHLRDPRNQLLPLESGLYRLGADGYYPKRNGAKYYSGTKQSFKKIDELMKCTQKWDTYRVDDMDLDTCAPKNGPWANRKPWKLTLEK